MRRPSAVIGLLRLSVYKGLFSLQGSDTYLQGDRRFDVRREAFQAHKEPMNERQKNSDNTMSIQRSNKVPPRSRPSTSSCFNAGVVKPTVPEDTKPSRPARLRHRGPRVQPARVVCAAARVPGLDRAPLVVKIQSKLFLHPGGLTEYVM
ncbi:unnamed protein product [Arctogadus glacialis]